MTTKQSESWSDGYARLAGADAERALTVDELEQLAVAAYLVGKDDECNDAWTRAHNECIRLGDQRRAARCAFWHANGLMVKGQVALGQGWVARGRRVLEGEADCGEVAWLRVHTGLPFLFEGDLTTALPYFIEGDEMATRLGDRDVANFARLGRGHCLVMLGETARGMEFFDELLVDVTAPDASPLLTGTIYCQVIATLHDVFDLRRAREWTNALQAWCDANPDLVPYRGNCLVHRAEILQIQGAWPAARDAAEQACEWLAGPPPWDSLGGAYYRVAEMHRLHGEFAKSDGAYRRAGKEGWDPEPGWSLLRLARGRTDLAVAAISRKLAETHAPVFRARILPAHAEIMLAAGDHDAARASATELAAIAYETSSPYLLALAEQASGSVHLAAGDPTSALELLRAACKRWQEIEAPYDAACVRVQIGLACRALGDNDAAALEFEGARAEFERLGAAPALTQLDAVCGATEAPAGLTAREVEVLALLAAGKTNREVAEALVISENTVARHVQNIFLKLDVSSRSAATAFAFEHGLAR